MRKPFCVALLLIALAACGPEPREAPQSGEEVRERAVEAQTARRRTGAAIQDRALNRVIRAIYM